jgi:hypothetical protein
VVRAALAAHPHLSLVLTGHSLGAGVAALLAGLWTGALCEEGAWDRRQGQDLTDTPETRWQRQDAVPGETRDDKERGLDDVGPRKREAVLKEEKVPDIEAPNEESKASMAEGEASEQAHEGDVKFMNLKCYAFGCPCVLSVELSRKLQVTITH